MFLLILLIVGLEAKKKFNPQDLIPKSFDSHIYCNSCQAIVRESLKKLRDSKSEIDVTSTLSNVCSSKFEGYAFVSDSITLGCKVFMSSWLEYLEEKLLKRKSNESFENEFCVEFTTVCKGIDPLEVQEFRKQVHKQGGEIQVKGKYYKPDENGYIHTDL